MQRSEAVVLVDQLVKNPNLKRHLFAVEAAVRSYAVKSGADPDQWGLAGLLHDADWEAHPDDHPQVIIKLLREKDEGELAIAINGHGGKGAVARKTELAKVLFACDELCGFIVAYSYMQPEGIVSLTPAKVIKKLKDKGFAATVSRVDIGEGAVELGLSLEEHVSNVLSALQAAAFELGLVKSAVDVKA